MVQRSFKRRPLVKKLGIDIQFLAKEEPDKPLMPVLHGQVKAPITEIRPCGQKQLRHLLIAFSNSYSKRVASVDVGVPVYEPLCCGEMTIFRGTAKRRPPIAVHGVYFRPPSQQQFHDMHKLSLSGKVQRRRSAAVSGPDTGPVLYEDAGCAGMASNSQGRCAVSGFGVDIRTPPYEQGSHVFASFHSGGEQWRFMR